MEVCSYNYFVEWSRMWQDIFMITSGSLPAFFGEWLFFGFLVSITIEVKDASLFFILQNFRNCSDLNLFSVLRFTKVLVYLQQGAVFRGFCFLYLVIYPHCMHKCNSFGICWLIWIASTSVKFSFLKSDVKDPVLIS